MIETNKMRQIQGLTQLCANTDSYITLDKLATLLLADLENCRFFIYGESSQEILAQLNLAVDGLLYEQFDKRIDLIFQGIVISKAQPPLSYCLKGEHFSISGRCSVLPQICGVDLYLNHYDEDNGWIRQNFSISLKKLQQQLYR